MAYGTLLADGPYVDTEGQKHENETRPKPSIAMRTLPVRTMVIMVRIYVTDLFGVVARTITARSCRQRYLSVPA